MSDSDAITDITCRHTEDNVVAIADLWSEFNQKFATDGDCLEEICKRAAAGRALKCCLCKNALEPRQYGARAGRCRRCNTTTWFTSGTLFHGLRRARAWLAAIWLMEQGIILTSAKLHRLTGVAQSSALNILRKIATVIHCEMDSDYSLASTAQFSRIISKRSRDTPRRSHPQSEEDEFLGSWSHTNTTTETNVPFEPPTVTPERSRENGAVLNSYDLVSNHYHGNWARPLSRLTTDGREETELQILKLLSDGPVHIDTLCGQSGMPMGALSATITILELEGLAKRLPGDYYRLSIQGYYDSDNHRKNQKIINGLADRISVFMAFIRSIFHGISRKYLQKYLAVYWCYKHRSRWGPNALFELCLRSPPVTYRQLLRYTSPAAVRIADC